MCKGNCNCSCKGEPGPRGVQGIQGPMGPIDGQTQTELDALTIVVNGLVNNGIFSMSLSLTSTQILNLFSSPMQIVAPPGVGKYIEVISASTEITYVSSPYTTHTSLLLINNGAAASQIIDGNALLSTISKITRFNNFGFASSAQTQIITNTALNISVVTGDPTGGDSTIKINLIYRIVTV